MNQWIALLRGVNVNGITVRSAELAMLFRSLGFEQVRTVLASGNVVFETATEPGSGEVAALKSRIETALAERFGYEAWIVLVPHPALARIIEDYPFDQDAAHHAYLVFASEQEALDDALSGAQQTDPIEQIARGSDVIYWSCPKGASTDTPFAKRLGSARFKPTTTTRNLNTLRKLL